MSETLKELHYLKAFGYEFLEQKTHTLNLGQDFKDLYLKVSNCELCAFSKRRKHCLLPQSLKKEKKLLILKTFVSRAENESGEILSSKNDQILKNSLKTYTQLEQEDFYLSYVLKCFSDCCADEQALSFCLPYFFDELSLVRPKLILCLGELCFKWLGFDNFKSLRGQIITFHNALLMPSFDLDFLSKNPSYYNEFIKDLTKLKGYL